MSDEDLSPIKKTVFDTLTQSFGPPGRNTVKVAAWELAPSVSVVLQRDQPTRTDSAHVWLPHPGDGNSVPDEALEYPGESGRHSNTYPSPGLERGKPALRLTLHDIRDVPAMVSYVQAMKDSAPLPQVTPVATPAAPNNGEASVGQEQILLVDVQSMPKAAEPKLRREAIPRTVQREVWQRDGAKCVECASKERLCFDHIVPFSRGGGNTVRNLQLLCERCNLAKGNRI